MSQFVNGLLNLCQTYQGLVNVLAAIVIFINAIMMLIPSDNIKKMAIKNLPYVLVGVGLALLAINIGAEWAAAFNF